VDEGPAVHVHSVVPVWQVPEVVLHVSPLGHAAHAAPPLPHIVLVWLAKGSHVLPLQQPAEHEAASQVHVPFKQASPDAQLVPSARFVHPGVLTPGWQV
jgi:hypothetical protein